MAVVRDVAVRVLAREIAFVGSLVLDDRFGSSSFRITCFRRCWVVLSQLFLLLLRPPQSPVETNKSRPHSTIAQLPQL